MYRPQLQTRLGADTLYLAFRAAFVTTCDLLMHPAQEAETHAEPGYLERLPLLKGCAPQIQLDCLLTSWNRLERNTHEPNPVDRCVCYCAAGELAELGTRGDSKRLDRILSGPRRMNRVDAVWMASKLRTLLVTWPFEPDGGMLLRDGNLLTDQLDSESAASSEPIASTLLQLLGCWFVTPRLLSNGQSLMTVAERQRLAEFFQNNPGLMNL
ncbi:MAG: hypothetical protein R3C49_17740 [Planctomycetaceae bacterium]